MMQATLGSRWPLWERQMGFIARNYQMEGDR